MPLGIMETLLLIPFVKKTIEIGQNFVLQLTLPHIYFWLMTVVIKKE